ncbi:MAG TPA: MFS transporter [Pseudolysinimonas sp.]|nr:MFS transporter [Pseudolysinimonas sp.]
MSASRPTTSASHPVRTFVALALSVASFASLQSLLMPVLPLIQQDLHVTSSAVTWTITAWLITAAVATPLFGRIGDMIGKRRMFVISVGAIAVGSIIAAFAPNLEVLILARVLQGFAGAIFPLTFGIIRDEFPTARVPGMIGMVSAVIAVGSGLGTVLSGPLAGVLGWRGLFLVPLLLTVVGGVMSLLVIPESPQRAGGRINPVAALLLSAWLVALLLPLSMANQWGWGSPAVWGLLVLAAALLVAWIYVETRSVTPLVDMRMMRLPGVAIPNATALLLGAAMFGVWAFLPRFLQTPTGTGYGLGETIAASGLVMLPMLVALGVAGFLTGPLSRRVDLRVQLTGAAILIALSTASFGLFHSAAWMPAIAGAAFGFGLGISNSAMASLVVQSVSRTQTGVAAGMNSNLRTIGSAIGTSLMAAIVTSSLGLAGLPTEAAYDTAFLTMAGLAGIAALVAGFVPVILRRRGYVEPIVITTPIATAPAIVGAEL